MPHSRPCIVCRSSDFKVLYPATFEDSAAEASKHFLSFRESVKRGRIVACMQCGFVFTNPQFSPAEYDEIYKRAPTGTARQRRWLDAGNKARARRLREFSLRHLQPGAKLFDFGAGRGDYLSLMRDFDCVGFDVAPGESPSDIKVYSGTVEEHIVSGALAPESFDAITAWDVFEHLPNLEGSISFLRGLLRPNGLLLVTVPNIRSASARKAKDRWSSLLLEHLWYFSPETLERFLTDRGFSPIAREVILYPVSVSHMLGRGAQTYLKRTLPVPAILDNVVIPLNIGLMAAAFIRR